MNLPPDNDSLEEIFENKEQIEVSDSMNVYQKPHAIAIEEWLNDRIYHRNTEDTNPLKMSVLSGKKSSWVSPVVSPLINPHRL